MSMTIDLSAETEKRLRDKAARDGKRPEDLGRQILESELTTPTLEEGLSRFRAAVLKSGETKDDSVAFFQSIVDAVREVRTSPVK